jgi:hypothetical protein
MSLGVVRAPPLADAVIDYGPLPMDMLYDILLCLPSDEVCRKRLVCRTWRSLMSDTHFARAHAPHAIRHRTSSSSATTMKTGS